MRARTQPLNADSLADAAAVCACNNFRKASRAVTQLFDEALQPAGLRSTQFVILVSIHVHKPATYADLSHELVMDRSTLSRNIKPLERTGWVVSEPTPGSRVRRFHLSSEGAAVVARAVPLWQDAQQSFVTKLGMQEWDGLLNRLRAAVVAARES